MLRLDALRQTLTRVLTPRSNKVAVKYDKNLTGNTIELEGPSAEASPPGVTAAAAPPTVTAVSAADVIDVAATSHESGRYPAFSGDRRASFKASRPRSQTADSRTGK